MSKFKTVIFALVLLLNYYCAVAAEECESIQTLENVTNVASKSSKTADPVDYRKDLLIVFDATGSMTDDLDQLRNAAIAIIKDLAEKANDPIRNYVLCTFRDPDVQEPFVTSDPNQLIDELNKIALIYNFDCPELSLHGLRNALEVAASNSLAFVFTDASSKDYDLYDEAIEMIQRKQIRVSFFLTGNCGAPNSPGFKVYTKLARVSDGLAFELDRTTIKDALLAISVSLDTDFVSLRSVDFEAPGRNIIPLSVDESFEEVMVSMSGENAEMTIRDSQNQIVTGPKSFSSRNIVITTFEVADTEYTIETSSTSEYSIRAGGISGLKFDFGFSTTSALNISGTRVQPIFGRKNILSIFVSKPLLLKDLARVALVSAFDSDTEVEVPLIRAENNVFATALFDVPEEMFKIKVLGADASGNTIDRVISTGIEADKSIPSVPCSVATMWCLFDNGVIPHSTKCERYYECVKGITFVKTCPENQRFDVISLECLNAAAALCYDPSTCV